MRFLHTSDWHLGRLFHGRHLTDDQAHVLDQLVELLPDCGAQALLIAGDIYDRAVPPVEAVKLLDDVLERIVQGLGIPVIAIAGNHDSPRRLGFGSRLLAARGLYVFGPLSPPPPAVVLHDKHGAVHFHGVPYAEPAEVRQALGEEQIHDHDAALRAWLGRIRAQAEATARHVLLAHAFVAGSLASDSERPLSVGGAGSVGADAFEGFDYVALGHLHRPQQVGTLPAWRYSGSLLKYSFSEADQAKRVLLVDLGADGHLSVEPIALTPRHDVRIIQGRLADLLRTPPAPEQREDYVLARLEDREIQFDPLGKLRALYPNVLEVERLRLGPPEGPAGTAAEHLQKSDLDLFAAFYKEVAGLPLKATQRGTLLQVLAELDRADREVQP